MKGDDTYVTAATLKPAEKLDFNKGAEDPTKFSAFNWSDGQKRPDMEQKMPSFGETIHGSMDSNNCKFVNVE